MKPPALEVLVPLRSAIIANAAVASKLGIYQAQPSIHTRRPVPVDAGYPMVTIGPIVARSDEDGINTLRPIVVIDLITYGEAIAHYRIVEAVSDAIYAMFHRQRRAILVAGYSVTQITASGPSPAPADGAQNIARRVTLTIHLFAS